MTLRPVGLVVPPAPAAGGVPAAAAAPLAETEVVLSGAGTIEAGLYFGPKDIDILRAVRPGMEKLIDYGWFAVIVAPLLWLLKQFHAAIPNWGVAIILATLVIKVLLFPLTWKQLVSMKKMSALQPKIEAIRLKWTPKLKSRPAGARQAERGDDGALQDGEGEPGRRVPPPPPADADPDRLLQPAQPRDRPASRAVRALDPGPFRQGPVLRHADPDDADDVAAAADDAGHRATPRRRGSWASCPS